MADVQQLRGEDLAGVLLNAPGPIMLDFFQASCGRITDQDLRAAFDRATR